MSTNYAARGAVEMTVSMAISGTIGWVVVWSGLPVLGLLFWRCVFGATTLLVVCAAMGLLKRRIAWKTIAWAALGGVALVLNWLLIFASFSRASIAIATVVYNTQPFMLVALGALFFSERLTACKLLWLAFSFAGVVLIATAQTDHRYSGMSYLVGIFFALGAAFFYAVAAIVAKRLRGTPPQLIALIQVCVGVLMLAPFMRAADSPGDVRAWGTLVALGVIYTGLVFVLLYGAIQKLPTHTVGALSFVYPVVAIGVDYLAFAQRLELAQVIGAAAILLSAAGTTLGWSLPQRKVPCRSPQP